MRVDEVVVISLPERIDRLKRLRKRLPDPWPLPAPQVRMGVREAAPPWFYSSDGAWGCRQAHLQVLESAWQRGVHSTLVLEDDAVFADDFAERWKQFSAAVPAHWDMVMLGGEHIDPPRGSGSKYVRCVNTRRTHAYVIRIKAIPELMRTWKYARRHIDHALTDFQQASNVYAPVRFLVGQDCGWSDTTTKNNPDVRFW